MNIGIQQNTAKGYSEPAAPAPLTRDLNVLGETLARLDMSLTNLGAQLTPITRPPEPVTSTAGAAVPRPALVGAPRSSVGDSMEAMAATAERMIQFVQGLSAHLEV